MVKREFANKFVHAHDFGVVAGIPSQQSQEVDYGLRQVAAFAVT